MTTAHSRKSLKKMKVEQLDAIAEEMGLEAFSVLGTDTPTKDQLVDWILKRQDDDAKAASELPTETPVPTAPKTEAPIFRELSEEEERSFRAFARTNPRHTLNQTFVPHPVVEDEWRKIKETAEANPVLEKPLSEMSGEPLKVSYEKITGSPAPEGKDDQWLRDKIELAAARQMRSAPACTIADLSEGAVFKMPGNNKPHKVVRVYVDEKARKHVVVQPTAGVKQDEMDLFYKNHLAMEAVLV